MNMKTFRITTPDEALRPALQNKIDNLNKPKGSMGRLEELALQIGLIQHTLSPELRHPCHLLFGADHGIEREGVSISPREITWQQMINFSHGGGGVNMFCRQHGFDLFLIDMGVDYDLHSYPGIIDCKVARGTRNFLHEAAMTEEETDRCIETGARMVTECHERGCNVVSIGEMGIGNTTTSSAVTAALLQCEAEEVTGRGAGLTDQGLARKQQVVRTALETYDLWHADAFTVLQTVGGLDIAGLTGMCIGGALWHVPIVLDGVISMAAALVAERLFPGVREYLIPSHLGKEPAAVKLADALQLSPVIHAGMALGEGTGAVMMFTLLDMAMSIYGQSATFSEIEVEQYRR